MTEDIDIALKTFDHVRAEIIARIQMRDTALIAHITAAGAVGAIYFGFASEKASLASIPFLVPLSLMFPLLSLVFAQIVSAHMVVIEELANFIRFELTGFFRENNFRAPNWDEHTISGDARVQESKTYPARLKHILVLHVPTIALSIGAAAAICARVPEAARALTQAIPLISTALFVNSTAPLSMEGAWFVIGCGIATSVYVCAIAITWSSFDVRWKSVERARQRDRKESKS